MKRFLIVLIVILVVGVVLAEAKVEFGNWNKWDEELPPWNNEGWVWEGESCCSKIISFPPTENTPVWVWADHWKIATITYPPIIKDVFSLFLTRLSFSGSGNQASIIFLSPANQQIKNVNDRIRGIKDNLVNAEFAIAAFPPKKGKVVIRVYENYQNSGVFQFFEKWTEAFRDEEPIFSGKVIKFTEKYDKWFVDQFEQQTIEKETRQWLDWIMISPRLIILDDKSFFIGLGPLMDDRRAPIVFFY